MTGYKPNLAARALRKSRTNTIGMVLPDLENPVYPQIVAGVQAGANVSGYAIVLGGSNDGASADETFARLLAEGRVDGLLISTGMVPMGLLVTSVRSPGRLCWSTERSMGWIA